jgi:hypothetical protein
MLSRRINKPLNKCVFDFRSKTLIMEVWLFSKKIVNSKPSNYGLKDYCIALSGPPLGLNDYSLAPPSRRLQQIRTASTNG